MLTSAQFDQLNVPITDLYQTYEQSVINDISRRLASSHIESAAWQMQRLTESGLTYENALEQLSKVTGKSAAELRKVFDAAGVRSLAFDDRIYRAAGLKPLPLNLSPAMQNVLLQGLRKTGGAIRNLTMTTALTAQEAFISAADLAYVQVSTGVMSYGQAIKAAVKQVARQGLTVLYPTGHKDRLDVAMRRAVLTGVAQTTGTLQLERAKELGQDLVQTSAHIGARPTHEVWQGKVFSLSGKDTQYPDFLTVTGYGTVTGLCGINCRHSIFPFFKGISESAYTQATLDEYADKTVTYNGKELSVYEAIQKQRSVEREIRKTKREAEALGSAKLDNTEEIARIRKLQAQLRDFVNQTGLSRQSSREGGRVLKVEV